MSMIWYCYILECGDKSLYTGVTTNLDRRINEHNSNKFGAKYTSIRRPVILKYFEKYQTRKQALKRENEIKGWNRLKKLKLIAISEGPKNVFAAVLKSN